MGIFSGVTNALSGAVKGITKAATSIATPVIQYGLGDYAGAASSAADAMGMGESGTSTSEQLSGTPRVDFASFFVRGSLVILGLIVIAVGLMMLKDGDK